MSAATPTHYCVVCAARWVRWPDGTWSVQSPCGPCCDNANMDDAYLIEFSEDGQLCGKEADRVRERYENDRHSEQVGRYRGQLCAICDEPFEEHDRNWVCRKRIAPRFKFRRPAESSQ